MASVFVSSTFIDLREHRKAVDDALRRMKENSVVMEYFGARGQEPTEACFAEIEQCQVFIGIYAHRYGYCPDGSVKSITELEYDHAQKHGLTMLCYIVSDDHPWPPKFIEREAEARLNTFKERISRERVRGAFTTPEDLASKVAADLAREMKQLAQRTPQDRAAAVWQKKYLAVTPPRPPEYMEDSRDDVLQEIREKVSGACKTVVLCGPGGEGKTSILARYAERYGDDYERVLWLPCGQKTVPEAFANNFQLVDALRPAIPDWKDEWDTQRKFERIVEALTADGRTGLLLLDNADERSQLAQHRETFERTLGRWTCLISTRDAKTNFKQVIRVKPLEAAFAFRLFVRLWMGDNDSPTPDDAERLTRLLARIRYHALLTEMLAKHLRVCRDEGLPDTLQTLLQKLSTHGLLGLPNTDPVRVEWQGQTGTPEQILTQLFDLADLDENQQTRLLHLALLPETPIPLHLLLDTLGIERENDPQGYQDFRAGLDALVARGWLDFLPAEGYRVHPLAAEVVRQRLLPDFERCWPVAERLKAILDNRKITEARVFLPLAEAVLRNAAVGENANNSEEKRLKRADLAGSIGDGYWALGNLPNAQTYFQQYFAITQTLAQANPHAEQIQREWAVANSKMGDVALALGQPHEARKFFEQYLAITQTLAQANPHAEQIQRSWAVANSRLGDVALALGQPHEARKFFEQSLAITQTLAQANPHAEQIQREWAVANSRLGDVALALGQPHEARKFFEQYLAITQTLAQANPHAEQIQREWAVANSRLGDVALALGQPHEARKFFEQSLAITQTLAQANPHAEKIQRDWAVANARLGDVALALGQPHEARKFFEQSLAITQTLAQANPHAEQIQRDWAVANARLGDVALALGQPHEARKFFEKDLAITQTLAQANPHAEQIQRDWAVANSKMGDVALALGQPHEARKFFEQYLAITQTLAQANPHAEQIQRDWAVANSRLGDVALALGQPHEARKFFEQYLAITQTLAQANPHAEQIQRSWAVANSRLGDVALALGQPHEARKFFEQSLAITQTLAQANPHAEQIQREWAVANSRLGDLALALGQPHEARKFFEQYLAITQTLAQANPHAEEIQREWAVANSKMGDVALALGQPHEARKFFEQYLAITQTLAQANPHAEEIQRDWAVALAKLGVLEIQTDGDRTRARALLEQAIAIIEERLAINPHSADLKQLIDAMRSWLQKV